jgi:hypothetical protein
LPSTAFRTPRAVEGNGPYHGHGAHGISYPQKKRIRMGCALAKGYQFERGSVLAWLRARFFFVFLVFLGIFLGRFFEFADRFAKAFGQAGQLCAAEKKHDDQKNDQ